MYADLKFFTDIFSNTILCCIKNWNKKRGHVTSIGLKLKRKIPNENTKSKTESGIATQIDLQPHQLRITIFARDQGAHDDFPFQCHHKTSGFTLPIRGTGLLEHPVHHSTLVLLFSFRNVAILISFAGLLKSRLALIVLICNGYKLSGSVDGVNVVFVLLFEWFLCWFWKFQNLIVGPLSEAMKKSMKDNVRMVRTTIFCVFCSKI